MFLLRLQHEEGWRQRAGAPPGPRPLHAPAPAQQDAVELQQPGREWKIWSCLSHLEGGSEGQRKGIE